MKKIVFVFVFVFCNLRSICICIQILSNVIDPKSELVMYSEHVWTKSSILFVCGFSLGYSQTVTGDTLVQSATVAEKLSEMSSSEKSTVVLEAPKVPEPMFFCTIEPASAAYQAGTVC